MPILSVSLKIPFDSDLPDESPVLIFTGWLPIGPEQGIVVQEEGLEITIWFDETCSWFPPRPNTEGLMDYSCVHAHHVYVRVVLRELSDDFLFYMENCKGDQFPVNPDAEKNAEYVQLVVKVLLATVRRVNRLIAYVKAYNGHYWLTEYAVDVDRLRSYCNMFEARGQIDERPLFQFCPPTFDHITASIEVGRTYIVQNDWRSLQDFVAGSTKPALVNELLAGAEYLLSFGHYRSAITEAVTALEVAIFDFSRAPNAEAIFGFKMADRLALHTLQSQIQHLGLSATIRYLLPIIIPECVLSTELLKSCQDAITQRQNVVHNGQRNLKKAIAKKAIADIRACCTVLETVTKSAKIPFFPNNDDIDA